MSDQPVTSPEETDDNFDEEEAIEDENDDRTPGEVIWTSDDALSFDEARRLTGQRGATVVLFAGDTDAGKTTAMVEVWTSLLGVGTLGEYALAGSNNALAFELRSFDSRITSGLNTTNRTDEDNEGFLHLSVCGPRSRTEILFADYAGEHFKHIGDGVEAIDELPWFGRVDRLAVLVDGALVASSGSAQVAFTRARRLLWKARDCTERNPRLRLAIVLSKAELVDDSRSAAFEDSMCELHDLALELDDDAPVLRISARPETGNAPWGLDKLLEWICLKHRPAAPFEPQLEAPTRAFGRFQ